MIRVCTRRCVCMTISSALAYTAAGIAVVISRYGVSCRIVIRPGYGGACTDGKRRRFERKIGNAHGVWGAGRAAVAIFFTAAKQKQRHDTHNEKRTEFHKTDFCSKYGDRQAAVACFIIIA